MKIFPTTSIKQLDADTIENEPIASIDLMERASRALARAIAERWEPDTPLTVFAGPGNNGGDALALARLLAGKGYRLEVYLFNTKGTLSPDCETNKERLADVPGVDFHEVTTQFVPPVLTADHVVIDGLFGSGLNKALSGGFAAVVKYINVSPATVVSIDIPSGLMGEDNTLQRTYEYRPCPSDAEPAIAETGISLCRERAVCGRMAVTGHRTQRGCHP